MHDELPDTKLHSYANSVIYQRESRPLGYKITIAVRVTISDMHDELPDTKLHSYANSVIYQRESRPLGYKITIAVRVTMYLTEKRIISVLVSFARP
jgi:hypothetical protein